MKRLFMMVMILILGTTLTGCLGGDEVGTVAEQFCEDNPEALICDNPDAARDQIVADMFNTRNPKNSL